MRRLLYMIMPALIAVVASSCAVETIHQEQTVEDGMICVAIEPEFDGLELYVKSLEIGKVNIYCYVYRGGSLYEGYPRIQNEINGNTYLFYVPNTSHISNPDEYYFVALPYDASLIRVNQGSFYGMYHESSEVTCVKKEYYLSSTPLNFYGQSDLNIGTVTLSNMQRDCKLMFNFTGIPEGETAENYVDKIHVKVGGMALDKVLTMEDLTSETVEEETLWCKTIYTVMGYDLFGEGFRTMDIIIETTDGKVFVVDQFKYNYIRNEQQRININFSE